MPPDYMVLALGIRTVMDTFRHCCNMRYYLRLEDFEMTALEEAVWEARMEQAQNAIRQEHNNMESKRFFGRKFYMPYHNEKTLLMLQTLEA